MRVLCRRFLSRSTIEFNLALSAPAVLSAESQPIFEMTTSHTRVPKMPIGVVVAFFHTFTMLILYEQ